MNATDLMLYWEIIRVCWISIKIHECTLWTECRTPRVISSLFWDVTQLRLVVTDVSGQTVKPIFRG